LKEKVARLDVSYANEAVSTNLKINHLTNKLAQREQ